ncbi:MAG: head GIN domain-containing protein [Emcibacteraceae bacterium]
MNKLVKIAGVSLAALSAAFYASSSTESLAANITKASDLKGFTKVQLNTSSDVNIKIGKGFSIEMVGDEDRIENTVLEVNGDTLKIKNKREHFNFGNDQEMVVNIVMPDIKSMKINGSGDAEITGVDNDELELKINGSGDMTVSGKTKALDLGINGSGDINMDQVDGNAVEISINGSGDVSFNGGSCTSMEIDIHGSGDVNARDLKCKDVDVDVSGSGDSTVYASNSITFDSHGSGEVDVYGKPKTVVDNEAKRRSKVVVH